MQVLLGNISVLDARPPEGLDAAEHLHTADDGFGSARWRRPDLGNQTTVVRIPDGTPISEALTTVKALWAHHSDQPPAWIQSDSPALQIVLSSEFSCPTKEASNDQGQ